jgi:hypothetical protein
LSQHKPEIGKNKYVSKVTVFRPDEDTGFDEPTIVYYVEDAPKEKESAQQGKGHTRRDLALAPDDTVSATEETDSWFECVCRGEKLTQVCKTNKEKAVHFVTPIDTPWRGDMQADLREWGYHEEPAMSYCSFGDIEDALEALGISSWSQPEGGLNYCYQVRHSYEEDIKGPDGKVISEEDQTYTVGHKTYRVSYIDFVPASFPEL